MTVGPDLTYNGGSDAFVAKVNAAGTALIYCGYIGGISGEEGRGIAVDSSGRAYVTGYTTSTQTTFPVTVGPDLIFNGSFPTYDAFVAKVGAANAPFSDNPLVVGVTLIRAVHITELRARIDAVRAGYGLMPFTYTDASIVAGTSGVMAVDITEMRTALEQAYVLAGLSLPNYSDPVLGAGTIIKAVHIAELRLAVLAIE